MAILIYIILILSIAMVILGFTGFKQGMGTRLKLPNEQVARSVQTHSLITKIFPFTPALLERLNFAGALKRKLDASHVRLSAVEFFNIKLLVVIAAVAVARLATGEFNPFVIIVAVGIGYLAPDVYLKRRLAKRRYAIARLLPETVDLLGLCVEAGLDFTTAVKWVVEKIPENSMIEELAFVLEEVNWGKSRTQALKDMSKRLAVPEVSSFVQALVQAERMGTPVSEAFAIISEDTRMQRFHHGERIAIQAPIKILVPLIFCILPVIAIVVAAPIFLQFTQGGLLQGLGK